MLDNTLEDAQSVVSIAHSDMSSNAFTNSDTPDVVEYGNDRGLDVVPPRTLRILVAELAREVVQLRYQNFQLLALPHMVQPDQPTFIQLLKCIFEWLLSLFEAPSTGVPDVFRLQHTLRSSSSPLTRLRVSFQASFIGISPEFANIASVRLRAGPLVGGLFRPDTASISLTQRLQDRAVWIGCP